MNSGSKTNKFTKSAKSTKSVKRTNSTKTNDSKKSKKSAKLIDLNSSSELSDCEYSLSDEPIIPIKKSIKSKRNIKKEMYG
jgi:hypothetical protein